MAKEFESKVVQLESYKNLKQVSHQFIKKPFLNVLTNEIYLKTSIEKVETM